MHPVLLPVICALVLPATPPADTLRADLEEGRYLKALGEADRRLKADPGDALAWAAKAQALAAQLRLPEALAAAEKSLALRPGLAEGLLARGLTRAALGVQQRNLGSLRQVSQGMEDLRAAVAADPSLVSAWTSLGLGYAQLPGLLGGSTRKALNCAMELTKLRPARGEALRGTVLSLDQRWPEAEAAFRRALLADPADPQVAAAYLEALGSRETREALGTAEQKLRLTQEARRLRAALGTRAKGLEAVSQALLDADLVEEAWTVAREALDRVDSPSLLRLQLGKVAARTGLHRDEGLAALDQVLREPLEGGCGGLPAAHWRRGQILRGLGRRSEAKAAAEAALRLDPKHPGARRLREELGG